MMCVGVSWSGGSIEKSLVFRAAVQESTTIVMCLRPVKGFRGSRLKLRMNSGLVLEMADCNNRVVGREKMDPKTSAVGQQR